MTAALALARQPAKPEETSRLNSPSNGDKSPFQADENFSSRRLRGVACRETAGCAALPSAGADVREVRPAPAHPFPSDAAPAEYDPVAGATAAQVERAAARLAAVNRSDDLAAEGMRRAEADAQAGAETGFHGKSVERWRAQVRHAPSRLAALLDGPRSGRPRKRGPGGWDGEGADTLWHFWCTDYLREEAPTAAAVYRRLAAIAAQHGWPLPTIDAFKRRTRREFSRTVTVRAREGVLAAMDTVPAQRRTVAGMKPLDVVNGDGRSMDVLVEWPNGGKGRPCLWIWQDVWSRRIVAYRVGETESADLVRTSLHDVIVKHGVPGAVLVDNTRAASAKWMTGGQKARRRWRSDDEEMAGLLRMLDIRYSTTKVDRDAAGRGRGRGRAKPVERAFLDLSNHIDSHPAFAGAGTGRSPVDRPETHRMKAVPLATFLDVLKTAIAAHNARPGRQTEAAAGRSFDDTWNAEIPQTVTRRISAAQAAILLLAAEESKVGRDGSVKIKAGRGAGLPANRYHSPALVDHAGRPVTVRFDPNDLHGSVHVYDRDGRWICEAPCLAPVGFGDTAAAGEYERARRNRNRSAERTLKAVRDMDALTEALGALPPVEAPPEPEPAAIRLVTHKDAPALPPADAAPARPGPAALPAANGTLNRKQESFCRHYAATDNAAEAARLAGYSERSARQTGHDLLQRPDIQARVQAIRAAQIAARPAPRRRSAALAALVSHYAEPDLAG